MKGIGPTVNRRDLAKAIAKNVPLARRKQAFEAAKEFGIKGVKGSYGKLSATEARKLVQRLKDRSVFKADLHARGETAKHVLQKVMTPEEQGPTAREQKAERQEKIREGGRRMLQDRLREEERNEGKVLDRARGDEAPKQADKKEVERSLGIGPSRLTPSQVTRTGGRVVPHDELPPAPGASSREVADTPEPAPHAPSAPPPERSASEWVPDAGSDTGAEPPAEPPALPI